jgi:hypothetical protein
MLLYGLMTCRKSGCRHYLWGLANWYLSVSWNGRIGGLQVRSSADESNLLKVHPSSIFWKGVQHQYLSLRRFRFAFAHGSVQSEMEASHRPPVPGDGSSIRKAAFDLVMRLPSHAKTREFSANLFQNASPTFR